MPFFDAENRLRTDKCYVDAVMDGNRRQVVYNTTNMRSGQCDNEKVKKFVAENANLKSWDGYGWSPCRIDGDSRFRYDPDTLTHYKCRQQLQNRVFQAVPQLYRGTVLTNVESRIKNSQDTSRLRMCDRISEKTWDVFNPSVTSKDTKHVIQSWTHGGENSRDIARSDEFLQSIGYEYDGRTWNRMS
jgi:hypothetical protein